MLTAEAGRAFENRRETTAQENTTHLWRLSSFLPTSPTPYMKDVLELHRLLFQNIAQNTSNQVSPKRQYLLLLF